MNTRKGYLVLSRLVGEQVQITCPNGDVITLLVVEIRGQRSRIGVSAPRSYVVHRQEVADRITEDGDAPN